MIVLCRKENLYCNYCQGRIQEFVQGGLNFLSFQGGGGCPLGPENPLKSIDFTGPGGLSPHSPP